jgi:phosphoglucosamine mutase
MKPSIRFGTDGVRGPAGKWPLDVSGARRIGSGIAAWVRGRRVLVGRDTRESGPALEAALIEGLVAGGVSVVRLGVVPTAAVSVAVLDDDSAHAGVMITASHNPWTDNGIKVVDRLGEKLLDATELTDHFHAPPSPGNGSVSDHPDPLTPWRKALPTVDLHGRHILLDAAHGAGAEAATLALEAAGATVKRVGCTPNGININDGVGAMHPPTDLHGCDFAICLDGDADRLVMVDPVHGILNGDDLLWMLSRGNTGPVVGTVMTNGGLEAALNGRLIRTAVGDAKVWAEMVRIDSPIGGEPSGHIMLRNGLPTSDGLYTALRILEIADGGPLPLGGWTRWPQSLRNVRNVSVDVDMAEIHEAEEAGCRVLVRASGTEPLVRVMVEGTGAEDWANRIAAALPRT